jgi:hypothetical protein
MARKLEQYDQVVKWDGVVTNKNVTLGGNLTVAGTATLNGTIVTGDTAVTAGGAEALTLSSASGAPGIYFGSGAPTVSAPQGSIYLRTDGSSTSTRLYVNTNGTTGWTNVTTAA